MQTDSEMETAKDALTELGDTLVNEGRLTHADAYFVCTLLAEYYRAEADNESGSKQAVEFAWDLARQLTVHIDEKPEFDWLNAYFVARSTIRALHSDQMDYSMPPQTATDTPVHFDGVTAGDRAGEATERLANSINELADLTDMYVDMEEPSDARCGKPQDLRKFFTTLEKRYAHGFQYEILECSVGKRLIDTMVEYREDDEYTPYDLMTGGLFIEEWLEYRSKEIHHALRTTGTTGV